MSDKYVIKNCPAYNNDADFSCRNEAIEPLLCQDCTDCLMKNIVELCGNYQVIDAGYQKVAINYLASDILKLLDIQECE